MVITWTLLVAAAVLGGVLLTLARGRGAAREARAAIDALHEAFISIDAGSRITDWNPAAERIFGWPKVEVLGRPLTETIIPPALRAAHRAGVERLVATGEGRLLGRRVEVTALRRDGTEVPVELTIVPVVRGRSYRFNALVNDISERKAHERYLDLQQQVASLLSASVTLNDAIPPMLELIATRLGWTVATHWVHDPEIEALRPYYVWQDGSDGAATLAAETWLTELAVGEGLAGSVWGAEEATWVQDLPARRPGKTYLRKDTATSHGITSAVALPVSSAGQPLAVLEFVKSGWHRRDPDVEQVMRALTAQLGQFVDRVRRAEMLSDLEKIARTDPLTGLPNRRAWDRELQRELARARRESQSVCVAMIDLDRFKSYNDTQGHPAADELLRQTARAWSRELRATDVLARLGGDEFAAILPDCDEELGARLLDRVRAATPAAVTCSVGVTVATGAEPPEAVVGAADRLLYDAKAAGRDCIAFEGGRIRAVRFTRARRAGTRR